MKYTNKNNLPKSLVDAISKNHYDLDITEEDVYSITTLINSPKIHQLTLRNWDDIEKDVTDEIWSFFGSMGHQVMESIPEKDRMIEQRLYRDIDGAKVTGKVDLYNTKTKCIIDYKFTGAYTFIYNPEGKEEWIQQLNCYAWLYRKAGFEVKEIKIISILRDWTKYNAKKNKDYPQLQVVELNIPLWTEEEQEAFIRYRIALHKKHKAIQHSDNIPECTPKERWAKDSVYAIYKNKNKSADKLCKSMKEAETMKAYKEKENPKNTYRIEIRRGEDTKCVNYCPVNKFCHYYKENYGVAHA